MEKFTNVQEEISSIREGLGSGFTGDNFDSNILYDYNGSSSYISDMFTEIADNQVPIYSGDLFNDVYGLYVDGWIDEAIANEGSTDMEQILIGAYFYKYQMELYDNEDDIIWGYVLNYIEDHHIDIEVTIDEFDYLVEVADTLDSNNRVCDIDEAIEDRIIDIEDRIIDILEDRE